MTSVLTDGVQLAVTDAFLERDPSLKMSAVGAVGAVWSMAIELEQAEVLEFPAASETRIL